MYFKKSPRNKGFTLIEVLIAMAIFGYAAVSLLGKMTVYQVAQQNSTQRTVAHWVAMNRLVETRQEKKWPNLGVTRGTADMANVTWHWKRVVTKTTEKDLRKIEVEVRLLENDELRVTSFTGFIANFSVKEK